MFLMFIKRRKWNLEKCNGKKEGGMGEERGIQS